MQAQNFLKKERTEFKDSFDNSLKKNKLLIIIANCFIRYSGRAESFLDFGDRLIIIKPDKTLIIHQPTGNNPVNYMKPATNHRLILNENNKDYEKEIDFILISNNDSTQEYIEIGIHKILSSNFTSIIDEKKIDLYGSEKDMSDYIYKNPETISKEFKPVAREEQTKYGFIDVFGYDKNQNLVVIECKRYKAGPTAPQQLRRYIERMSKSKGIPIDKIKGIIAAPSITKNAEHMLNALGYEFKRIEPPAFMNKKKEKQKDLSYFE
jgi:endonuclease